MSSRLVPRRLVLGALAVPFFAAPARAARAFVPLFHVARSKNANIVQYDAATVDPEHLDPRDPVTAYWIMRAERGQREGLSALDQRAYGFRIVTEREGLSYLMVLRAAPDRSIRVVRWSGRWIAQMVIARKNAILERIFVLTDESGLLPRVLRIDLHGAEIASGSPVVEQIVPR